MEKHPPGGLSPDHPDFPLLKQIETALMRQAGGYEKFCAEVPQIFRKAIDEVIDAPRTNRFTIDEIEKTEKTYLGTKIEILFRSYLKLPKGEILDLNIDGIETDIKNTIGATWTLPLEVHNHPCILIACSESKALCSIGLVVVRPEYLNPGKNRDQKSTISKAAFKNIYWILRDAIYPENFWEKLDKELRKAIMTPAGGTERLAVLFRNVQRRPISRLFVQAIAQQHDYMKRIRRNGGARDILAPEGIAILWGQKDRKFIDLLALPPCGPDEFISVKPELPKEIEVLRKAGHID